MDTEQPNQEIASQIKFLTVLMGFSNLTSFVYLDFKQPIGIQLAFLTPFVLAVFPILYYFYRGRNWARILILIGAALGLTNFLLLLSNYRLIFKTFAFFDGCLAVYVLYFLNTPGAKQFFKERSVRDPLGKQKMPVGLKIVLAVLVVIGVIVGLLLAFILPLITRTKHMALWLEDVSISKAVPLVEKGSTHSPRFSHAGTEIVFDYIPDEAKDRKADIMIYSFKDNAVRTLLGDGHNNRFPVWGPGDEKILYVSDVDNQDDLWIYSLEDRSNTRLTNDFEHEAAPQWSSDGKWVVFEQTGEKGNRELFLISSGGGKKKRLTFSPNFLEEPQNPVWMPDSNAIAYFSFVSVILIDLEGTSVDKIDLAGLNNFKSLMVDPSDPEAFIFAARPAEDLTFKFNLYKVPRTAKELKIWKESRDLLEVHYDISPDGSKLIYSGPRKKHT